MINNLIEGKTMKNAKTPSADERMKAARAYTLSVAHIWQAPDNVYSYLNTGSKILQSTALREILADHCCQANRDAHRASSRHDTSCKRLHAWAAAYYATHPEILTSDDKPDYAPPTNPLIIVISSDIKKRLAFIHCEAARRAACIALNLKNDQ